MNKRSPLIGDLRVPSSPTEIRAEDLQLLHDCAFLNAQEELWWQEPEYSTARPNKHLRKIQIKAPPFVG